MFINTREVQPNTRIIAYNEGKAIYTDEEGSELYYDEIPKEYIKIGGIMLDPSFTTYKGEV